MLKDRKFKTSISKAITPQVYSLGDLSQGESQLGFRKQDFITLSHRDHEIYSLALRFKMVIKRLNHKLKLVSS